MNELKYARRVTTPDACSMDVPRTGVVAKKRKRGLITISAIALGIFIVTIGLSRLKPAVPLVDSSTIWADIVKRWPIVRQVRGLGMLVPEDIRWVPANTEGRVEKERQTNDQSAKNGLIAELQYNTSKLKQAELANRNEIEQKRLSFAYEAIDPRLASKQAAVDQTKHAFTGDECGSAEPRVDIHDKNPQIIRSLEQQWAQAYANRDTAWLSCILGDDFEIGSMPDQACATHSKQNVLDWVATRTGSAELELLQIKPHDNTVMARGVYSVRRGGKLVSRFQFTDVFVYRSSRWQAVARTIAELPLK